MSFKRKAERTKVKKNKDTNKRLYKEEIIEKFYEILKEHSKDSFNTDPKLFWKVVNDEWNKYITIRQQNLNHKEYLQFRSQILPARAKINLHMMKRRDKALEAQKEEDNKKIAEHEQTKQVFSLLEKNGESNEQNK